MGSLLAATASYLDARRRSERWLLRIDDLDKPRVAPGAEAQILTTLEAHGLHWDGPVDHQSSHQEAYHAALSELAERNLTYFCLCSRNQLADQTRYPGTCRNRRYTAGGMATRIRTGTETVQFTDLIAGFRSERLADTCGDFVIKRRDGLVAYQLATAIDDGVESILHVVRGRDLLGDTARQIYLMSLLGLAIPSYAHLPTLLNCEGQKLSKQSHAPGLNNSTASANLATIFGYLGMHLPAGGVAWRPTDILNWGVESWSLAKVPRSDIIHQ